MGHPPAMLRLHLVLSAALLFAACDSSSPVGSDAGFDAGPATDGGDDLDGGDDVDAGDESDAGPEVDAGDAADAGLDGGPVSDAGRDTDGGEAVDAGADAGAPPAPACAAGPCPPECFRAVSCVAVCGGPVIDCGCCGCAEGSIDSITCGAGT